MNMKKTQYIKSQILILLVLFVFPVILFAQMPFVNTANTKKTNQSESKNPQSSIQKTISHWKDSLPKEQSIKDQLEKLNQEKKADTEWDKQKQQEWKKYYTYILILHEQINEFHHFSQRVQKAFADEKSPNNKQDNDLPGKQKSVFSLSDFTHGLQQLRKLSSIVDEKNIILSQIMLEQKIIMEKTESITREIRQINNKIQILQKKIPTKKLSRADINKQIETWKSILKAKQQYSQALTIETQLLKEKLPIAKLDKEVYEKQKKEIQEQMDQIKNNLSASIKELNFQQKEIDKFRESNASKNQHIDHTLYNLIIQINKAKKERNNIYLQMSQPKTPQTDAANLSDRYELMDMEINLLRAQIKYYEYQKYYYQFQYELKQAQFNILRFIVLDSENKLSIDNLNKNAANLADQVTKTQTLMSAAQKEIETLQASIKSMQQILRTLEDDDQKTRNRFVLQKINHLNKEIKFKEDFIIFLREYKQTLDQTLFLYEEIRQFIEKKTGLLKLLVQEKTQPGWSDIYKAIWTILLLLIYAFFHKTIVNHIQQPVWKLFSKFFYIFFPGLAILSFFLGINGYDFLYQYLFWALWKTALIVYTMVIILAKFDFWLTQIKKQAIAKAQEKLEIEKKAETKEDVKELTEEI